MQILIFRNEIKYDHGLMGVGLVLSLEKNDFLRVDGQAASCCVWEAGGRRKS